MCMYVHLQLHFQAILYITSGVGEPGKCYNMQGDIPPPPPPSYMPLPKNFYNRMRMATSTSRIHLRAYFFWGGDVPLDPPSEGMLKHTLHVNVNVKLGAPPFN